MAACLADATEFDVFSVLMQYLFDTSDFKFFFLVLCLACEIDGSGTANALLSTCLFTV